MSEEVCNIGEKAYKEHQIESLISLFILLGMLKMMKLAWQDINISLKPFKSVTSIVTGWDEI